MAKKRVSKQPIPKKKPASAKGDSKPSVTANSAPFKIAEGKKAVLHVGCGSYNPEKLPKIFRGDDWQEIRLDIDPDVKPDVVSSMLDMSVVPDNSVAAIFSSHNVEHLHPHEVSIALKEFYRVLQPTGFTVITLPNIEAVAAYVAEGMLEEPIYDSPAGPISAIDIFYGHRASMERGNLFMAHKTGFSNKTLAQHLLGAGFHNVEVKYDWVDLWATASKPLAGDARFKHQARLVHGNFTPRNPSAKPLPMWYQRRLQMLANPEAKTDELDAEPSYWKAPNLKA